MESPDARPVRAQVEETRVATQLGADGSAAVTLMRSKLEKPKYNNCTVLATPATHERNARNNVGEKCVRHDLVALLAQNE